ncbi:MAG: hypothetical protein JWR69_2368, partial [Pedosphaera sp.]|nr:hypothetical protein [Pedosphaera sp.]
LPEAVEIASSMAAVESSRGLLAEPDPIPPLIQKLLGAVRAALNATQADLEATFQRELSKLEGNPIWQGLTGEQKHQLVQQFGLQPPVGIQLGNEDEIFTTLQSASLGNRRTLVEALPQRFARALDEAMRLLEPQATRIILPSATIRTEAELDDWLAEVRGRVQAKLGEGPVIV